jgi:hypothetical protein
MPQLMFELLYTLVVTSFIEGSLKVTTLMDCNIDLFEKTNPQSQISESHVVKHFDLLGCLMSLSPEKRTTSTRTDGMAHSIRNDSGAGRFDREFRPQGHSAIEL